MKEVDFRDHAECMTNLGDIAEGKGLERKIYEAFFLENRINIQTITNWNEEYGHLGRREYIKEINKRAYHNTLNYITAVGGTKHDQEQRKNHRGTQEV